MLGAKKKDKSAQGIVKDSIKFQVMAQTLFKVQSMAMS
jgi:hypothetical protein